MRFFGVIALLPTVALTASGVDFAADIEPILRAKCYSCHGDQQQLGQLRLDSREVVMASGPSGPRIVPRDPESSAIYQRIAGLGDGARMPMGGQLAGEEIESIRAWIEQGAIWPEGSGTRAGLDRHWAFVTPSVPSSP